MKSTDDVWLLIAGVAVLTSVLSTLALGIVHVQQIAGKDSPPSVAYSDLTMRALLRQSR